MGTFTNLYLLLLIFYAGAVFASARCWLGAWRGNIRFAQLRDLTGISDRAALRRLFGLTSQNGFFRVTMTEIVRRRRLAGTILTDLPVHSLFLLALAWAAAHSAEPTAFAIACAALAHAIVLGAAAASILIGRSPALTD
jgi:hypothetical protein